MLNIYGLDDHDNVIQIVSITRPEMCFKVTSRNGNFNPEDVLPDDIYGVISERFKNYNTITKFKFLLNVIASSDSKIILLDKFKEAFSACINNVF